MQIHKQKAQLKVPNQYVHATLEMARALKASPTSIVRNHNQVIMDFDDIEAGPMWLLDLRRAGVPYLWLWGTSAELFRFISATLKAPKNTFRINVDVSSFRTPNPSEVYTISKEQFLAHNIALDVLDVDNNVYPEIALAV